MDVLVDVEDELSTAEPLFAAPLSAWELSDESDVDVLVLVVDADELSVVEPLFEEPLSALDELEESDELVVVEFDSVVADWVWID